MAWHSRPACLAMARTVAESSPPLSKMTARIDRILQSRAYVRAQRLRSPEPQAPRRAARLARDRGVRRALHAGGDPRVPDVGAADGDRDQWHDRGGDGHADAGDAAV